VGVLVGVLQTKIIQRTAKPKKIGPIQCSSLLKHVNKSSRLKKTLLKLGTLKDHLRKAQSQELSPQVDEKSSKPKGLLMHQ
jgi:hypothetical protein